MFALPGQSMEDLDADLREALSCGAQQLTAYPLFTFPYSAVASHRALQGVQMPRLPTRRRMFRRVWDRSTAAGFAPVSVWSFMRPEGGHRYSSVTRRRFLGLGPSAASFDGRRYLLNTFSVPEYVRSVRERGHAVALSMPIEPRLERLYDFYWRLYDTYVPKTKPGASAVPGRRRIEALLDAGGLLGMLEQDASGYRLNRRGAFWIHVAQNYFFLSDVNTIWATALRDPWPARIAF
jgi:oxygen-independent coproporphyrinogen-3 oxidase